ncbi:serine/threonine protein kinase [Plesiocystis pacifica SIR-1]|uniref:non-specific serine/threonine protein kinase n=2 Tax=Plesiocystis pacifica TaxID=191768 RepID=A6G4U5_9BACT|nr:serine/threonine protein kinase [Plesiocystis pacifica SIR-1]
MIAGAGDPVPEVVATAPSAALSEDLVGQTLLGRYEIIKRLGEGGMGTVYLGEHKTIKKRFAVKVLSQEFAHKEDLRERFLQEARAASMIPQENVVEITDFGDTPNGSVFFIMEFLDGEDLSDTVKDQGQIPWARVKPIMLQICRALAAAHDAGIIHRDMKPENCYRIKRGKNEDFIKVLDFGIAKVTSDEGSEGKGLTRTGMIFGTPEYMSPEQAQGAKPDHRVDVYACGVIMYELLTGRVPFTADTFMGILTKHMFEVPEAPSSLVPEANIPEEVEAIILKAMQKDRELRFADMTEMAAAIEAVGSGAGAVAVVAENIARPSTGEMAFTGGRQTMAGVAGTVPPVAGAYEEPQSSNKGLYIGVIGGLVLAAAGIGGFLAFGGKDKQKTEDAQAQQATEEPAAVAEQPEDPEVEPEPEPEPEPEKVKELTGVETVNLFITTKDPDGEVIQAKILDPLDNAIYGMTYPGDEAEGAKDYVGVPVAKSKQALNVLIVAKGYESQVLEKYPTRDKKFEIVLQPVKKATKKTKKSSKKTPAKKPDPAKTDPAPKPETKPAKKKTPPRLSPDLKDPFGN